MEPPIDPPDSYWTRERCEICDWPLAESRDKGCVQGDCAYRPPEGSDEWYRIRARRQALERARDEAVKELDAPPPLPSKEPR